ncbi:ATP-binding protein [uncultured Jatrophihabitans sp.]|uniref:ATP-binding protein n=1 Tax=uncultured Jatrophihabitans sp. TaxID=1610747 RepID=UPI0035CC5DB2
MTQTDNTHPDTRTDGATDDEHYSRAVETLSCTVEELRSLFLFEKLSDDQLDWLCQHGKVERYEPGWIYREGEPGRCFFVLVEGSVAMSRQVGGDNVEITRTDEPGVYAGAWSAYLGDRVSQDYPASLRALSSVRLYVLGAHDFADLMRDWFPMPVHLLEGLFFGSRNTQQVINQRERLLALGSLSAGLTHELNNPAAAAVRATSSLRERVSGMRHKLGMIAEGRMDREGLQMLVHLQDIAVERVAKANTKDLNPLEVSDREDEMSDWFEDHDIDGGYELAPVFVAAGLDIEWLDRVAGKTDAATLGSAVRWLNYALETELLMNEIEDATGRITTLVGAAKQYSQMDRGPYQVVDVHELLDSTLVMLSRKIGSDVRVVKEYDRSVPDVPVFAAELNQVWTNIIDNALQAMDGAGTLTLRTSRVEDDLQVEIANTGPQIPEDVKARIFEPFFTTKAVGEGTGLGLDISWRIVVDRHHGDLSVHTGPDETSFVVRVPLSGPADAATGEGSTT